MKNSLLNNKKGITWLLNLAYVLVALIIVVGVGLVVATKLQSQVVACANGYHYNESLDVCANASQGDATTPTNTAWTALNYGKGQMGSTGLLSYLPLVIILVIGMFFLSYFMGRKQGMQ